MTTRAGSSRPVDIVDVSCSPAPPPESTLSVSATTDATFNLSAPITTRATNNESGARTKAPYTDIE